MRIPLIAVLCCVVTMPLVGSPAARGRIASRVPPVAVEVPILVPLSYDRFSDPGLWTALYIHNRSSTVVSISGAGCPFDGCRSTILLNPLKTTIPFLLHTPYRSPGLLVYTSQPEDLSFSLQVFDGSKFDGSKPEAMGTDVPVIRESELLSVRADLLGVWLSGSSEVTLRIYGSRSAARFLVRFFDDSGALRKVLATVTREFGFSFDGRPTLAASVQIDDLANLSELLGLSRVRIEVEPEDPQTRFWTFITVWNKQTGQITTVTPQ